MSRSLNREFATKVRPQEMKLPDGWTWSVINEHSICLERPQAVGGGYVTVDFKMRWFAPGRFAPGSGPVHSTQRTSTKAYALRGWTQEIVTDAIAWLEKMMTTPYKTERYSGHDQAASV